MGRKIPEDRYALCFDSDEECLGETALRLLRMGIVFEDLKEKLEAELRRYIDERAESTSI